MRREGGGAFDDGQGDLEAGGGGAQGGTAGSAADIIGSAGIVMQNMFTSTKSLLCGSILILDSAQTDTRSSSRASVR